MKIIKPGVLNTKVLCGTCERCGCEVEAEKDECRKSVNPDAINTNPSDLFALYVECPTQF